MNLSIALFFVDPDADDVAARPRRDQDDCGARERGSFSPPPFARYCDAVLFSDHLGAFIFVSLSSFLDAPLRSPWAFSSLRALFFCYLQMFIILSRRCAALSIVSSIWLRRVTSTRGGRFFLSFSFALSSSSSHACSPYPFSSISCV